MQPVVRTLVAVLSVSTALALPAAAALDPSVPRLRPTTTYVEDLIADGARHSLTFRALLRAIEREDVLVYVETSARMSRGTAAATTLAATTPQFRVLRIAVARQQPRAAQIALIAHELQHAIEVAREPSIVDEVSLAAHYETIGFRIGSRQVFDTKAAVEVGYRVRDELGISPAEAARLAETTGGGQSG